MKRNDQRRPNQSRDPDRDRPQRLSISSDYPFKSPPTTSQGQRSLSPRQHHRSQDRARSPTQMVKQFASQHSTLSDHEKLRTLKEQIMRNQVPYYKPNLDALLANVVPPLEKGLSAFERERRFSGNNDIHPRRSSFYDDEDRPRKPSWDDPQDRRRLSNQYGDSRDRDIPRDAHARRYSGSGPMDVDSSALPLSTSTPSASEISGRRPISAVDLPSSTDKDPNGNLPIHLQRSSRKGSYSQLHYPSPHSGPSIHPPASPSSERGRQRDGDPRFSSDHPSRPRPLSPRRDQSRDRYSIDQTIPHRTGSDYSPVRRRSSLGAQSQGRDPERDGSQSRDGPLFEPSRRDFTRQEHTRRPAEDSLMHVGHSTTSSSQWGPHQRSPPRASYVDNSRLPPLGTTTRERHRDIGASTSPEARMHSVRPEALPPHRPMPDRDDVSRRGGGGDGSAARGFTPPRSQSYSRDIANRDGRFEGADQSSLQPWRDDRVPIESRYTRRPGDDYPERRPPSHSGRGRSVEPRPRSPLGVPIRDEASYRDPPFDRGNPRWDSIADYPRISSSNDARDQLHASRWNDAPPGMNARFHSYERERGRSPPSHARTPIDLERKRSSEIDGPVDLHRRPDDRRPGIFMPGVGIESRNFSPKPKSTERTIDRTLPTGEQYFHNNARRSSPDAPGRDRDWQRGSERLRGLSPSRSPNHSAPQRSPLSGAPTPFTPRETPHDSDQSQPPRWRSWGDGSRTLTDGVWRDQPPIQRPTWSRPTGRPKADDLNDAYPPPPPLPSTHTAESVPLNHAVDSPPISHKETVDSGPDTSKPSSPMIKSEPIDDGSGRWISTSKMETSRHSSIHSSVPMRRPSIDRMSVDAPPTGDTIVSSAGTQKSFPAESPGQSTHENGHNSSHLPSKSKGVPSSPLDNPGMALDVVTPDESSPAREPSGQPQLPQSNLSTVQIREKSLPIPDADVPQRSLDRRHHNQSQPERWAVRDDRNRKLTPPENSRDSDRPLPPRDTTGVHRSRDPYFRDNRYEPHGGPYPPLHYQRDQGYFQDRRRSPDTSQIRSFESRRPPRRLTPSPPPLSSHYQSGIPLDEHRTLKRPRDKDSYGEYDRRRIAPPSLASSSSSAQPMWDNRMSERDRDRGRETYDYQRPPPLSSTPSRYDERPYDPRDRVPDIMPRGSGRDWGASDQRGFRDQGLRK